MDIDNIAIMIQIIIIIHCIGYEWYKYVQFNDEIILLLHNEIIKVEIIKNINHVINCNIGINNAVILIFCGGE